MHCTTVKKGYTSTLYHPNEPFKGIFVRVKHFRKEIRKLFEEGPIYIFWNMFVVIYTHNHSYHYSQLESVGTTIKLEQSMTDRRRSEFTPIEYADHHEWLNLWG